MHTASHPMRVQAWSQAVMYEPLTWRLDFDSIYVASIELQLRRHR